ncbi:MAG: HTH-type transcriptional regulator MhqR [Lentisphaerae bacterium ADurb.BinA184]|nr:MAG: HTH-type transcriptional regulator MhqR [Lentisphaerae bacterium ADurb.BinA184]
MKAPPSRPRHPPRQTAEALLAASMLPLWRRIGHEFAAHMHRWDLPPNALHTLLHLHLHPGTSEPAELAEAVCLPRQTVTFILDTLERRRLATRRPHPSDRRRKTVAVTAKGHALAARMFADLLQFEATALKTVAVRDIRAVKTFLNQYADALAAQNLEGFQASGS